MSNLGRWGLGESIDTHIVGGWNKNDKVTSAYPRGPQCPWGPKSAQNVPFWFLGSRGIQRCPYCRVLWKKISGKIFENFRDTSFFYIRCLMCPPKSCRTYITCNIHLYLFGTIKVNEKTWMECNSLKDHFSNLRLSFRRPHTFKTNWSEAIEHNPAQKPLDKWVRLEDG